MIKEFETYFCSIHINFTHREDVQIFTKRISKYTLKRNFIILTTDDEHIIPSVGQNVAQQMIEKVIIDKISDIEVEGDSNEIFVERVEEDRLKFEVEEVKLPLKEEIKLP